MEKVKLILIVVLPIFLLVSFASGPETSASGPLVFEKETIDLGKVSEGQVCNCKIRFRNSGSTPARIQTIKVSCSCIAVGKGNDLVKPGEESSLAVKFHSQGKLGVTQSKCLVSYESGGRAFLKKIQIVAQVVPRGKILAFPQNLYLGNISSQALVDQTIMLRQQHGRKSMKQVRVLGVEGPEWLELKLCRPDQNSSDIKLVIRGKVPNVTGSINDRIVIKTDDKIDPECVILISGIVQGNIVVQPKSIVRVVHAKKEPFRFLLNLRDSKERILEVFSIKIEGVSEKAIRIETSDGPEVYQKIVTVIPSSNEFDHGRVIKGSLIITVHADGENEKIRVPFLFMKEK